MRRLSVSAVQLALCAAAGLLLAPAAVPWRAATAAAEGEITALRPGEFQWFPERSPSGPVVVVISLDDQLAHVYRNGVRIGVSTVSTGKTGYETPTGVFRILEKKRQHTSNLYDDAPMPYMTRLTWSGVALHAGHLPGYPASHGCVRLPLEFSRLLYEATTLGTTVVITDERSIPGTVLRAAQIFDPALLDDAGTGADGPASSGALQPYAWQPELSPQGPVSLLLSAADRRVYVYRNGVEIGRSPVTLAPGGEPLGDGVFTLLAGDGPRRWMAVDLGDGDSRVDMEELRRRVTVSSAFVRRVYGLITPGTTLVVTDRPAGGEHRSGRDFVVLADDGADDGETSGDGAGSGAGGGSAAGVPTGDPMLDALHRAAPRLDPQVLALALDAARCAGDRGTAVRRQVLAVIDYSLPSTEQRLWVFDLAHRRLLYRELVAHGEGSGANYARLFSNREGSHQSSLGLFLTAGTYQGRNGYSLRLVGLEKGINDLALARTIVMHGAWYVTRAFAAEHGRLGRSWGCPALRPAVARQVIDALKGGSLLFVWHPDLRTETSLLTACTGAPPPAPSTAVR